MTRKPSNTKWMVLPLMLLVPWVSASCGEEEATVSHRGGVRRSTSPGQPSAAAHEKAQQHGTGMIESDESGSDGKLALPKLSETDFIAGAKHRDPFKPFLEVIGRQEEVRQAVQREIKLKEYDIADLRLIGIITNVGDPRAMVVTPEDEGFVLRRGDYVGRADFVDTGSGGEKIQVNWRVARIHGSSREEERGVYLVRDDPTTSKGLDVTRFMPLHPAD